MPGNANITAEEITRVTTLRDAIATDLAWCSGTTGTYSYYDWLNTATFDSAVDSFPAKVSWTGDGYVGWWNEWRTNNPSVTSGELYDTWNYDINGTGNGIVADSDAHHAAAKVSCQTSLDGANAKLTLNIANAA